MPITLYSWRHKDPSTGRWRVLRWKMTEPDAAQHARVYGVEVEKVAGSAEVREPVTIGWGGFVPPAARRP